MQANVKTKNSKKLKVKALVDSGCTHTRIDEQLVKDKRIQTKPINFYSRYSMPMEQKTER